MRCPRIAARQQRRLTLPVIPPDVLDESAFVALRIAPLLVDPCEEQRLPVRRIACLRTSRQRDPFALAMARDQHQARVGQSRVPARLNQQPAVWVPPRGLGAAFPGLPLRNSALDRHRVYLT